MPAGFLPSLPAHLQSCVDRRMASSKPGFNEHNVHRALCVWSGDVTGVGTEEV